MTVFPLKVATPSPSFDSAMALSFVAWLIMSGFVSVGYTPQTTDICVCRRHVDNVGPTGR